MQADCILNKTYRRVGRVTWVDWLVCECSASKMSAYCLMYQYEHSTYDQSDIFCSEAHLHVTGRPNAQIRLKLICMSKL